MRHFFRVLIWSGIFSGMALSGVSGQIGGSSAYEFLNTIPSARISAVGGYQPSLAENDPALSFNNPALLDSALHNHLGFSYANFLAGSHLGYVSYARNIEDFGMVQGTFQYMNYGTFERADVFGNREGSFTAGDYNLTLGHSVSFNDIRLGANLKFIYSQFDNASSFGVAADVGGFYFHEENEIGVGAVIRNAGVQLAPYHDEREPLPFDIQIGATKKLINAPFRFTLLAHSLQQPDLTFKSPGRRVRDLETGEFVEEEFRLGDRIFRHVTAATEIVFSRNLQVRLGYNHQRRSELALESRQGLAGFSWGAGFKVSRFHIDFSRAIYHLAATSTHISVTSNLDEWFH